MLTRSQLDGTGEKPIAIVLAYITNRLSRLCKNTERDARQHLKTAERNDIMIFLEWILDNYRSRKRINLRQKFKHWRQLFRKHAGRTWPELWTQEVNDVRI